MGSNGLVALKRVFSMLDDCAPGHTRRETKHHYWIQYNELEFKQLPLGAHGRRDNPEIQRGVVRKMCRHFGILECAESRIESL